MIAERVDDVLRRQLGAGFDWTAETTLNGRDGLALDSLDMIELIMRLEEEFGTAIPDDPLWVSSPDRTVMVGDVVAYLEHQLAQKPALFA